MTAKIDGVNYTVKVLAVTADATAFIDMSVELMNKTFYLYNVSRFDRFFATHPEKLGPTIEFWKSVAHEGMAIKYMSSSKIIINNSVSLMAGQHFQTVVARPSTWTGWAAQRIGFDFSLRTGKPIMIYGKFLSFDQKEATFSVDFNLMEKIVMSVGVLGLGVAAAYMGKKEPPVGALLQRNELLKAGLRAKIPEIKQKFPQGPNIQETANIISQVDAQAPSIGDVIKHPQGTQLFLRAYQDNPSKAETGYTYSDGMDALKNLLEEEKHGGGVRTFKVSIQDATLMFWQNLVPT